MKRVLSLAFTAILLLVVFLSAGITASADPALTVSDECIDILKQYEGFCKYPYWDYGQWTVGYGTRCPADKLDTYKENGITEEEAEALLRVFVADYEDDLHYFINKYSLATTQNQFDAMFLMSYNCGSGWIYSTSSNFHKAMADPTTEPAMVLYQFGTWSNAGDSPMVGLIRRRLAEANMYLNGVYSKNRPTNFCYVIYEPAGGEIEDCVHAYDVNLGAVAPITPTLPGYLFEGWFTDKVEGTQVTTLDASTDGITLYARWVSDGTEPELPEDQTVTKLDPPVKVKVITDELNLRKGPGTNYATLTYVVEGDTLTVTATAQDDTGRLWGSTDKGWACLQYTDFDQVTGDQPKPDPEPEQPEAPEEPVPPAAVDTQVGTVIANGCLYIREGPGTSYKKVGEYFSKSRIRILEQQENGGILWGRTDKGWVSMAFVRMDTVYSDQTNDTVQGVGARPVYKGGGKGYGVKGDFQGVSSSILDKILSGAQSWGKIDQDMGSVNQGATQDKENKPVELPKDGKLGTVCVDSSLNIRSGAGSSYPIAGFYRNGDRVAILEEAFVGAAHWGRTEKGWINMVYVTLDEATEEVERTVTASCLMIRKTPDMNGEVVDRLYAGDKVTVLETCVVSDSLWGKTAQGWIALAYTE